MPIIEYRERGSDPSTPPNIANGTEKFHTVRIHERDGLERFEVEDIQVLDKAGVIKYSRSKLVGPANAEHMPFAKASDVIMTGAQINEFPQIGELNGLSFTFALTEEERGPDVG